jgi:hypothetical protein
MDTEIRYRESSARPFESTGAFLTADDVNELCQRRIEAERERTHALLTELLIQICGNTIPEVVSTLPELRGPTGPAGKLSIVKEWTRETVFYEGAVVMYDGGSYQALRDTGEPPDNAAHWQCLAAPGRDAKPIANFYATIGRRYVAILLGRRKQVVQVQSTDQCELATPPCCRAAARV